MDLSYWDIGLSDEKEMWLRVIGLEQESPEETELQAATIFSGIPGGKSCLEIGAGVGRLLKPASRLFSQAVGIDYSEKLVASSREYLKESPSCTVMQTDGVKFPFDDAIFDFVYSYTVFHHMPTRDMVQSNLREAFRVLRPLALCRIQTVRGDRGDGYDGWVYPSVNAFRKEFQDIGFDLIDSELRKEPRDEAANRIWITARKP